MASKRKRQCSRPFRRTPGCCSRATRRKSRPIRSTSRSPDTAVCDPACPRDKAARSNDADLRARTGGRWRGGIGRARDTGALGREGTWSAAMSAAERRRLLIVLGLCLTFGIGLVGHGLPFWLAAAIFVSTAIAVLQYPQRRAANQVARGLTIAIVIGLGAGLLITLVFQEFFLVRLP